MTKKLLSFLLLIATGFVSAQECTSQWEYYFDTDPLLPKVISGDSSAGYAIFSFWGDPSITFEIHGEFPKARFLSYETQETRLSISVDALLDYEIVPNSGSENPFREGAMIDSANRAYTLVATQATDGSSANTIRLAQSSLAQQLMLRIYSPNEGVKLSSKDLPRIFALDTKTGKPVACPKQAPYPIRWEFPQLLADLYTKFKPFEFKMAGNTNVAGLNKAASYMYGLTPLKNDEVVLIRFQAPSFVNTRSGSGLFPTTGDVRYWSFCTSNLPNNETLNCLPDYLASPQADGYVYLAVGTGDEVKKEAADRGFSFLPDTREPRQKVMGFVYRNLVPAPEFSQTSLYQGNYIPEAFLCGRAEFIAGVCHW